MGDDPVKLADGSSAAGWRSIDRSGTRWSSGARRRSAPRRAGRPRAAPRRADRRRAASPSTVADRGRDLRRRDGRRRRRDDTPPTRSDATRSLVDDDDVERLLTRRRRRRGQKRAVKGDGGTSDRVRMYLREIGQVDLLTTEDERRLAQLIEEGHVGRRADRRAGVQPTPTDERMLMRAVQRGERAKSELTQANLRLVVSIAKRYSGRGMQLLDLIQEGNLGLMRAVDKFDHTKGFKFSTYATWWIRQAITRSIADQARTIRIPVHMVEHMNRVTRAPPAAPGARARADGRRAGRQAAARAGAGPRAAAASRSTRCRSTRRSARRTSRTSATSSRTPNVDGPADAATRVMLPEAVEQVLGELSRARAGDRADALRPRRRRRPRRSRRSAASSA